MEEIPTVDLQAVDLQDLSPEERLQTAGERIYAALKGIGFVYLTGHGLPEKLCQSAFRTARDFFTLPLETKLKYKRFIFSKHNGYTPMMGETLTRSETGQGAGDAQNEDDKSEAQFRSERELKEAWDVRRPDLDMPAEAAPEFSRDQAALMAAFQTLSLQVLGGLEAAMGRPGLLTAAHQHQVSGGTANLRSALYPALPDPVPAGAVRCATHSDWGSVTLLLQDSCGGLEVLSRSGGWVPAPPVPGAVLCNVGDLMEIWTGGEIVATKHRVRLPETEEGRQGSRLSLIFFSFPDDETMVEPPTGPAVNAGEYLAAKFRATMPAYSAEEQKPQ